MMIDIQGLIWFGVQIFIYSTILLLIFLGLTCAFIFWYYWFVVRHRVKPRQKSLMKLDNRSFVFHTLSFQISDNGIIVLNVQLSAFEKKSIELGELNGEKYQISSIDIQDEQIEICFIQSNIRLVIQHENVEQQRLEKKKKNLSFLFIVSNKNFLFFSLSYPSKRTYIVHEYTFTWSSPNYRTRFNEKINLDTSGHWYGGATQKTVRWPINECVTKRQAMIPNDAYK